MDFNKARERAPSYFAESQHGFLRHSIHAPFVSDKFMMTEQTSDNLLIARSDQLIDSSPLNGAVHSLPPITVQVASQSDQESLWDHLVRRHHYLGYQKLLGHRIKYLAISGPAVAAFLHAPAHKPPYGTNSSAGPLAKKDSPGHNRQQRPVAHPARA